MPLAPMRAPITEAERARLEEATQLLVDQSGLVKTAKIIGMTPMSVRNLLAGGFMYAKSLARIARHHKMTALAKQLDAYIAIENAPPKNPRGPRKPKKSKELTAAKKKVTAAKKKVVDKTKAMKKGAKAVAAAPNERRRKAGKPARRHSGERMPRVKHAREPVDNVPVGADLDAIEAEDADLVIECQAHDEMADA